MVHFIGWLAHPSAGDESNLLGRTVMSIFISRKYGGLHPFIRKAIRAFVPPLHLFPRRQGNLLPAVFRGVFHQPAVAGRFDIGKLLKGDFLRLLAGLDKSNRVVATDHLGIVEGWTYS